MSLTQQIKVRARELGFDLAAVVPAVAPQGITQLRHWLERGFAGDMHYMKKHAAAREHPRHVLDGVRSIVMVAMNYRTGAPAPTGPLQGRLSCYAWGSDYHHLMRRRLKQLGDLLHNELPDCRTRAVVDTAPLMERDFAQLAGIGWIGKNTMLINKRLGSWLFLGALLTDAELEYDSPHAADHCGTCTRCLDACPTGAFTAPHQLDSRRCISYLTVELRGPIPEALRPQLDNWLFGCDVCQDVCPWNRKAPRSQESEFDTRHQGGNVDLVSLLQMSDDAIRKLISSSAMTRAGVSGLRRNAAVVLGNSRDTRALPALHELTRHPDAAVSEAARWAIEHISKQVGH
jgi:epoxyqueuosine reductase